MGEGLWDTSFLLTENSIVGKMLHTLIGYVARPDGIQLLFYAATVLVTLGLMKLVRKSQARAARVAA
jgi:high-affinity iron transporter